MNRIIKPVNPVKVILVAGLIAGTLDITAACANAYINNSAVTPGRVFRFVASGVFGKKAFAADSTVMMSTWGLIFHYVIATSLAAFFVFVYTRWSWISRHILLAGVVYGILAWLITARVIVPLSNAPAQPFAWKKAMIAMLIIVFMIGVPVALITQWLYKAEFKFKSKK